MLYVTSLHLLSPTNQLMAVSVCASTEVNVNDSCTFHSILFLQRTFPISVPLYFVLQHDPSIFKLLAACVHNVPTNELSCRLITSSCLQLSSPLYMPVISLIQFSLGGSSSSDSYPTHPPHFFPFVIQCVFLFPFESTV